ncbi:protein-L-isoaspartate O-methyltransferase family protein [Actinoplanes sp. CA-030573]|uniref:protein-L-isoaspartate O-methyltransferase family protein n=1 Tax=Actinoplanes sp. CA-030573 TaxID=3239898 RepID=UPI003D945872
MALIDDAIARVPADYYLNDPHRGATRHWSDPDAIRRELTSLDVRPGDRVYEVGTGTGYSSALLAELVGPGGQIVSIDISDHLTRCAERLHQQRGIRTVRCVTGDGLTARQPGPIFDRVVVWCTPARLARVLVEQLAPDGRMVVCLPIAPLPSLTMISSITLDPDRRPKVETGVFGGYAQSTLAPVDDPTTIPGRWVDWSIPGPQPSWVAIGWRDHDDLQHTGARTALARLLEPGQHEPYPHEPLDWRSLTAHLAAIGDPQLTVVARRGQDRGIGHSTPNSAAAILDDGTLIADRPGSPSLATLRTWLAGWENAGRPGPDGYTPVLAPAGDVHPPGWDLSLRPGHTGTSCAVPR